MQTGRDVLFQLEVIIIIIAVVVFYLFKMLKVDK